MKVRIMRMLALVMCLLLLPAAGLAESRRLPLQEAHRVTMKQTGAKRADGIGVYRWEIATSQPVVTEELNTLAAAYVTEMTPKLSKPGRDGNGRLDVAIRHSRTGLTWMSFMVQSRYVLNKVTKDVRFTTRTYDMATGQRLMLTDVFPADSEVWTMLENAVREGIEAYYPSLTPDADALEAACRRENIAKLDFTLHAVSLVLHLHAGDFYRGKQQLIEVPLYYPDIRPYMTGKAQAETDNLTYYDTVALTYDDGPTGWITREILNVLLKTGERATFFVLGERIRGYEQYVQREHDEGHSVATHTYTHTLAKRLTPGQMLADRERVDKLHLEVLGIAPRYARAPGGEWHPLAAAQVGWPLIHWTSQGTDWEGENGRDPIKVKYAVISSADDGGIILMHDLKLNAIEASELFITALQEQGYIFLTVDELFAKDGVALEPDTSYWRCTNGVTVRSER